MNAEFILARLRRFLLWLAGLLFAGSLLELTFIGHVKTPVQFIPFGLCAVGLAATGAALARPRRPILLALRWSMGLVALGGLFGMLEHVQNNVAFKLETQPGATLGALVKAGLGGANPLLAPAILALAALLAAAATYYHPALRGSAPAERRAPARDRRSVAQGEPR